MTLDATATVSDGGIVSYLWYSNTTASTIGGTSLGITTATYMPNVAAAGTSYYYCLITNTNNAATGAKTATETSAVSKVTVINIPNDILAGGVITAGTSFGSGAVTILFTDNTTTNDDALHIYGLDSDIVTNTTGLAVDIVNGSVSDLGSLAGWNVGDNNGIPKTIIVTFTDGAANTSEPITFSLEGNGGENLN